MLVAPPQLAIRKMVIPLAVAVPASPLPAVPAVADATDQDDIVGTDVRATDGMTVTEALLEPASAPTGVEPEREVGPRGCLLQRPA